MEQKRLRSETKLSGNLSLNVKRKNSPNFAKVFVARALPHRSLPENVRNWRAENIPNIWRGLKQVAIAKIFKQLHYESNLYLDVIRPDIPEHLLNELLQEYVENYIPGISFPYWLKQKGFGVNSLHLGLASMRVVTDVGVGFIVDAFQNTTELENMKFHGIGTAAADAAEAAGDTALETELTTEYSVDNTRATGTTTEGATANIYRTVGTNTVDAAVAIDEHGIFDQAATGGGVLLDRSLFADINLGNGDSLQSTYDLTLNSGS